jgi:hypothetical protein
MPSEPLLEHYVGVGGSEKSPLALHFCVHRDTQVGSCAKQWDSTTEIGEIPAGVEVLQM